MVDIGIINIASGLSSKRGGGAQIEWSPAFLLRYLRASGEVEVTRLTDQTVRRFARSLRGCSAVKRLFWFTYKAARLCCALHCRSLSSTPTRAC
jgi:hypothetical protein